MVAVLDASEPDAGTAQFCGGAVKRVDVGRTTALGRGAYTITMVGQKADDNTLHLTVQ
jgi:hypothetical protein